MTGGRRPLLAEEEKRLSGMSMEVRKHEQDIQEANDMRDGRGVQTIRLEHIVQAQRLGLVRQLEFARQFHLEMESSEAVVDTSGAVNGESGEVDEQTSTPLTPATTQSTVEESVCSTPTIAASPVDPEETTTASTASTPVPTKTVQELGAGKNGEEAKQMEAVASLDAKDVSDMVCDEVAALSHALSTSESGARDSEVSDPAGDDSLFDSPAPEVLDWSLSEPGPLASSSWMDPRPPPPSLLARLGMEPVEPVEPLDAGPVAPPQAGGPMRGGRGRGRGVGRGRGRGRGGGNPQGHRGTWRGRGRGF